MTNYSTSVPQSTQKIFVHPWYIQQQLLENTTTSASPSRLKQSREEIGQKYIDENEVAWAAGLYEGEGTLYWANNKHCYCLRVKMTDPDVVNHFGAMWDLKVYGPYTHKNNPEYKPWTQTETSNPDKIFAIVCDMYPYLGERRREKCDEFIAWYKEKKRETAS